MAKQPEKPAKTNTGISLPTPLHDLLRRAARGKQAKLGGRCSVSQLIEDFMGRHTFELERMSSWSAR